MTSKHTDLARLFNKLPIRKSRHGWKKCNPYVSDFIWHTHPLLGIGGPQRPTVKRLLVGVIELESARPSSVMGHAVDNDIYPHILCFGRWLAILLYAFDVAHVQVTPKEISIRHRNGSEITPVDRNAWPFLR